MPMDNSHSTCLRNPRSRLLRLQNEDRNVVPVNIVRHFILSRPIRLLCLSREFTHSSWTGSISAPRNSQTVIKSLCCVGQSRLQPVNPFGRGERPGPLISAQRSRLSCVHSIPACISVLPTQESSAYSEGMSGFGFGAAAKTSIALLLRKYPVPPRAYACM
jgi:hypothetical protein